MIFPCKDCQKRYVGCHGSCEAYKAAQAEQARIRETQQKEHGINGTLSVLLKHRRKTKKYKRGGY